MLWGECFLPGCNRAELKNNEKLVYQKTGGGDSEDKRR